MVLTFTVLAFHHSTSRLADLRQPWKQTAKRSYDLRLDCVLPNGPRWNAPMLTLASCFDHKFAICGLLNGKIWVFTQGGSLLRRLLRTLKRHAYRIKTLTAGDLKLTKPEIAQIDIAFPLGPQLRQLPML
jgi:hypothetical protein